MKKQSETSITIRFPAELVAKLRALAKEETRSLNSQVVHALNLYTQQKGKGQ